MVKLILHIPHSSHRIPNEYREEFTISDERLSLELLKMTDAYTDELFPQKYRRIIYPVSRLVCDPERFRSDDLEEMSKKGMGAVYMNGFNGENIRNVKNREAVLKKFYDTHHANLERAVESVLDAEELCLIVDCHSFSNIPLPYEDVQDKNRPDVCIGTDNYHTPKCITDICRNFFAEKGYRVKLNEPYGGTIVPIKYYKNNKKVYSVMIEINRSLYMDESGKRNEFFANVKKDLEDVCALLEASTGKSM